MQDSVTKKMQMWNNETMIIECAEKWSSIWWWNDQFGDEITNALNSLDVDFRTVIILCDLEDFTYEEMAKILDIPIGTVRSRLHRARNLLKNKLAEYASSLGYNKKH